MYTITHTAMGSPWHIEVYQEVVDVQLLQKNISRILDDFDTTYSRFSSTSLISKISHVTGTHTVPKDLVVMLRDYGKMYSASGHKINPLVGGTIEDLGYDASYSLIKKNVVREVPSFETAISINSDTSITVHQSCLIDIGALGKGYCVGLIGAYLDNEGYAQYVINGSGDLLHKGHVPVKVGLENPFNTEEVIGTIQLKNMALASSGSNRRAWADMHHIIDPETLQSPQNIVATWVLAHDPAHADILSTAIFLVSPDTLKQQYEFEWLIVSSDHVSSYSKGFIADLF